MNNLEVVCSLIQEALNSKEHFDRNQLVQPIDNLGLDSLMTIHLITLIEDRFDIEIDGINIIGFNTRSPIEIAELIDELKK